MSSTSLIGNERIKKLLQRAVAEDRIGQSLLMSGPRGVGKYQFAIALAQALNCEQVKDGVACGTCGSCLRIKPMAVLPPGRVRDSRAGRSGLRRNGTRKAVRVLRAVS